MKQWLAATSSDNVKQFYDKKYEKNGYDQFKGGDWSVYKELLEKYGGSFEPWRTICDFGCGHGEFLFSLNSDLKCTGFEISPHALKLATQRLPEASLYNLPIELFNANNWKKFDYVTCLGVIEHTMSPVDCFRIMFEAVRENGVMLIVVPLEFEGCLDAIAAEENKITNERFMTAEEWIDLFPANPCGTKICGNDIALIYKK